MNKAYLFPYRIGNPSNSLHPILPTQCLDTYLLLVKLVIAIGTDVKVVANKALVTFAEKVSAEAGITGDEMNARGGTQCGSGGTRVTITF